MSIFPSIQDLQAFEAAARQLSFLHAAQELNITAGAVSRRIQNLETLLGIELFRRHHRQVALTQRGHEYFLEISDILARIGTATNRVRLQPMANTISICIYPTLAFRWLIPRWSRFYNLHPEIDVRLTTSLSPVDFKRDDYDLAVQVSNFQEPIDSDLEFQKLVDVILYPACSPQIAQQLNDPGDLKRQTLLHGDIRPNDWPRWLELVGLLAEEDKDHNVSGIDPGKGLHFESSNLAIQAAIEGLGVVMGVEVLIQDDLAAGRLVKPFNLARYSGAPFQIVYPKAKRDWQQLNQFRNWLITEVAAT